MREHHRFLIRLHLGQIDALEAAVAGLEKRIERVLSPFRSAVERLCTIPGFSATVAAGFLAETGGEMKAFPTDAHLVSWGGLWPQMNETGGKRKNMRTRRQQCRRRCWCRPHTRR